MTRSALPPSAGTLAPDDAAGATGPAPRVQRELPDLFDQWIDADAAGRAALQASLQARQPALHARLMALVAADAAADAAGFLAGAALPLPGAGGPPDGAAANPAWAGVQLGPWRLARCIGSGGMGEVWQAQRADGLYQGSVAVKLLRAGRSTARDDARFAREGELLARLSHPHIARLLDAGHAPSGQRYLVLELVAGQRIDAWCDQRQLTLPARLALFGQVCEAVAYAHSHLVVHRDLKPANVLVTDDGQTKLLDFGVAKLLDDQADATGRTQAGGASALTREAAAGLTPEYAAPEQLDGGAISTATDVYALGVLLFGLLSGGRPYAADGSSIARLGWAVVHEAPLALPQGLQALDAEHRQQAARQRGNSAGGLAQALTGDLSCIVAKALQKQTADRYPTVAALHDDIQRHLAHQPIGAQPDRLAYRVAKFLRRHRLPVAIATAALLATTLGAAAATWQWRNALQQAQRTQAVVDVLTGLFTQIEPEQAGSAQVSVRELLQRGWSQLQQGLAGDAELRSQLAWSLGMMLNAAGDVPTAQQALEVRRAHLQASGRADTPDYLRVLLELGFCAAQLADHASARRHYGELLAIAQRQQLASTDTAALARLRLATLARSEGRLAEAEQGLRQVAAAAQTQWGASHPVHTLALDELADLLRQRGQWDEAQRLYARLAQAAPAPRGAAAARAQLSAATLLVELGRFAEAAERLPAVVALAAEVWGDADITHTTVARLWLAQALFRSGQQAQSDAVAATALQHAAQADNAYGRLVIQVLQARHALRRGQLAQAAPLLASSLAELDAGGDAMKPLAERARMLQGEHLLRQGDRPAARRLLDQTLAAQRALYPQGDTDLWPTLVLRALAQDGAAASAARADLDEAAALAQQLLPAGHPDRHVTGALARLAAWPLSRPAEADLARQAALDHLSALAVSLAPRGDLQALHSLHHRLQALPAQAPPKLADWQADLLPLLGF